MTINYQHRCLRVILTCCYSFAFVYLPGDIFQHFYSVFP